MKKIFVLILFCFLSNNNLIAQEYAGTEPELRNVVLEEYTGIHCGNCPGGHEKAKQLSETYPGRVVVIAVHEGSYANPKTGEPDFRTEWGQALLSQAKISGFPAATVNRQGFSGKNEAPYYVQYESGMAMSTSGWINAAEDSVLNGEYSPLNIGAGINWNNDTREISIETEVYFTDDIDDDVYLNIVLLESHVWGPQTGAADPQNYEHNHILRDMITGQWGETISGTDKGSLFSKIYTYTVSPDIDIVNCDIAIFVTSDDKHIYTGIDLPVIPVNSKLTLPDNRIIGTLSNSSKSINFELQNLADTDMVFELTIDKSEGVPADWEALPQNIGEGISLGANETKNIEIEIITGDTKSVADFYITVSEKDNPVSNSVYDTMTLVTTDIDYLEVNAGGTNLGGLQKARSGFITLASADFYKVADYLGQIKFIMWNNGRTGRLYSDDATMIDDFIANGIGVMINGTGGVPSLMMENSGHELFTTLGVSWSAANELDIAEFTLSGVAGDPVTDGFSAPGLTPANNGYLMQSLDITAPDKTFPMLKMPENGKIISIRAVNDNAKLIYLGFNLDIIEDMAIKNYLILKSIDWIEGVTGIDEDLYNNVKNELTLYPNYISGDAEIFIENSSGTSIDVNIQFCNSCGQCIETQNMTLNPGINPVVINTSCFSGGIYYFRINSGEAVLTFPVILLN